jgi:hypothetical protein
MCHYILCPLTQPHRSSRDDYFGTSYQQWLSTVEVRGRSSQERLHPPAHYQTSGYQYLLSFCAFFPCVLP